MRTRDLGSEKLGKTRKNVKVCTDLRIFMKR